MRNLGAILFVLSAFIFLRAQNEPSSIRLKRLKLQSIELGYGLQQSWPTYITGKEWNTLFVNNFPEFGIIHSDAVIFSSFPAISSISVPGANMSFAIRDKRGGVLWGNPVLRVGLSYKGLTTYEIGHSKWNTYTTDSFHVSFQDNEAIFIVDSIYRKHLVRSFSSDRVRANGSVLWQTKEFNRLSFYAGFGFGFGISPRSTFEYSISEEAFFRPEHMGSYYSNTLESGYIRGPMVYEMTLSTTLGVNYRLRDKNNLLGRASIFGEITPTIFLNKTSTLPIKGHLGIFTNGGIRLRL